MPSKKKRIRRRHRRSHALPILIALLAAFAAILIAILVYSDPLSVAGEEDVPFDYPESFAFIEQKGATAAPLIVKTASQVIPTATPKATAQPQANSAQEAGVCPTAAPFDYFLPVYESANLSVNEKKMIAVTIDDCDDAGVLSEMVSVASRYDAKLTLFPTGQALMTPGFTEGFRDCVKSLGYEIENYGFTVKNEYRITDNELVLNIWKQSMACSYALGGDYQQHFYRPAHKNNANDQRTHFVLGKLGLYGMATYTHSYEGHTIDSIVATLDSGNIYRFDMSEESLELYKLFVRAASEKGYELVTLNELFGYEENVLSNELTIDRQTMPSIDDYQPTYYDLELGDRAYAVIALQKKLMELGYLDPETNAADGYYGAQTSIAVSKFQAEVSLPAIGDADAETQAKLFAIESPGSAEEN